jgi:hypothetical protein
VYGKPDRPGGCSIIHNEDGKQTEKRETYANPDRPGIAVFDRKRKKQDKNTKTRPVGICKKTSKQKTLSGGHTSSRHFGLDGREVAHHPLERMLRVDGLGHLVMLDGGLWLTGCALVDYQFTLEP